MATFAVQNVVLGGVNPTLNPATNVLGDQCANDGNVILFFRNTSAIVVTVTINAVTLCNQGFDHDVQFTLPVTSGEQLVGPFPTSRFNTADGFITWTYSGASGVSVGCYRVT